MGGKLMLLCFLHVARSPPLPFSVVPVIKLASSDNRKGSFRLLRHHHYTADAPVVPADSK